jgi:ParB/RepB/Spo0J family partition protein
MDLELHQLDLRYAALRSMSPRKEKQVIASLADVGQQLPIVVIHGDTANCFVVIDGYKRVRAAQKLAQDTVRATLWQLDHKDALVLERLMRTSDQDSPIEQGWLLRELHEHFGLSLDELARRFDKSKSWVSRRVALVLELPEFIQARVRDGTITAQAAMKYLVPLARANAGDCHTLVSALSGQRTTTRQLGTLYAGYKTAAPEQRQRLVAEPWLFLRAHAVHTAPERSPYELLLADLGALGGIARRAARSLREGVAQKLLPQDQAEAWRCMRQSRADALALFTLAEKELGDARPEHTHSDLAAS